MNTSNTLSRPIIFILGAWLLLNLIQASFTELFHDEALFWVYSLQLDWGYWDHAPMIGLMTKWGTTLLPGNVLGVRLFTVLLSTISVYLIYLIAGKKDVLLFVVILLSMVQIHVGGFFAAPDSPLAFFVILFFYLYKQYLEKDTLVISLLLALTVALMLYSKYHGAMILFFILLSNLALLRRKSFWLIVVLALILYIPHLNWLHHNDYATFQHHIVNRSKKPYNGGTTLNFLYSQILFFGPFVGLVLLPAAFKYKIKNDFERALKFCFLGVMLFLFLLSFNGRVEANWSAVATLPVIILGYQFIRENESWRKWLFRLGLPSILLLLAVRVMLIVEYRPTEKFMNQYSGWPEWAEQIQTLSQGAPVVFVNGYQMPSKYAFYTGQEAPLVLNNYRYHQTQFDLWDLEPKVQGKKVMVVIRGERPGLQLLELPVTGKFSYEFVEDFHSFNKIRIEVLANNLHFTAGSEVKIPLRLYNEYDYPVELKKFEEYSFYINVHFRQNGVWLEQEILPTPLENVVIDDFFNTEIQVQMPKEPGEYKLYISLATDWIYKEFSANGSPISITVE